MKTLHRFLFAAVLSLLGSMLHAGNLTVTLNPSAAASAGARWQVDGGGWKTSGQTVNNLSNTTHTVAFKAVTGWLTPASTTVSITNGNTTTLTATYVQPASLKITLTPTTGQWRIDGGAWVASGATAAGLTPGNHAVDYSSVAGYASPATETVTLVTNQTTTLTRSYTQLAQLQVTLAPTSGQWRVDSGAWQASSATVANLLPGSHTVDYAALNGYSAPPSESVTLTSGQLLTVNRSYIQLAQLTVSLTPATAQWRVDGGTWHASGAIATNLALGNHTVDYAALAGYSAPPSESVTLASGQLLSLTRSFIQLAQLTVTLTPASAQWSVDGGAWQNSGVTVANLSPGTHTVAYAALSGYTAPAGESVTLASGQSLSISRSYVQLAQLAITLTPSTAQWRVDGGAWLTSGATAANLTPGNHTVDYSALAGFTAPPTESVALASGQSLSLSRSYIQLAQLTISLTGASGQWRVDGGTWQASGATVANLSPSTHAVDYSDVSGFIRPDAENVSLTPGQALSISRSYTPLASLSFNLTPNNAQWRLDGGAWQNPSATLNNLPLGAHTVDYSDITGYITPASETVTLVSGPNSFSRTYTPLASLTLALSPASAQWRLDGGAWQNTTTTLNNLSLGAHSVDYSDVTGYITPASESISLVSGANTLTRNYTALASFNVSLTPNSAQWRLDGGAWQFTSTTLNNLPLGSHTVDYLDVTGYIAPPSETVTLVSGPNSLSRTYTPLASLAINLTPSNAQWRLDGGAWQNPNTTLNNLTLDTHTIDYSAVTGYLTPASESVTLSSGQNLVLNRSYTQLASLAITLSPNSAFWRLDGGVWQNTFTTLNDLALGSHEIDYSDVAGYVTPPSESVSLVSGANSLARTYASAGPAYAIVKDFYDAGATPAIVRGSDGACYVATNTGGSNSSGQVFRINADGTGYAIVKTFIAGSNAAWAPNSLIEGSDHVLYGTTQLGGNANTGTLFKVNKDGTGSAILYSFDNVNSGTTPNALIEGADGLLYGTTQNGGMGGYIFRISKDGTGYGIVNNAYGARGVVEGPGGTTLCAATAAGYFGGSFGSVFSVGKNNFTQTLLKNFSSSADGATPRSAPLLGSDGVLYGTTSAGGSANKGVVYRLNVDGTGFAVVRSFLGNATDGGRLDAPLSEGPDGALYGATFGGGSANRGTAFRINKDGTGYAILRQFLGSASDGGVLSHRLLVAVDGTIVGANTLAGGDAKGVLFRMNNDGSAFSVLRDFGAPDGSLPMSVTEASDGVLYGITYLGGGSAKGAVFKVNKDGTGFGVLHRFATTNDGATPLGQILEASDGLLYGTTMAGSPSSGTLFRLNKDGSGYVILHGFGAAGDGWGPGSGVIEGSDGALYGTTLAGGSAGGYGTVYRIDKDGTGLTLLHSFANGSAEGNTPAGRLTEGANGMLYGTTSSFGTTSPGTVFALGKDGTGFTVLHQFAGGASDGATPYSSVCQASDGRLYGTTSAGGAGAKGTVFGLNIDGSGYVVLKNFAGGANDGATPYYGGVVEKNGVLYGVTNAGGSFDGGTLFALNKDGTGFVIGINFGLDAADGRMPVSTLFKASDGALYGATNYGGNGGTVFRYRTN